MKHFFDMNTKKKIQYLYLEEFITKNLGGLFPLW
jgi:hypothetical protein